MKGRQWKRREGKGRGRKGTKGEDTFIILGKIKARDSKLQSTY